MNRKIYVVFPICDADPVAAFTVRKAAEYCCYYLDSINQDGNEHFIADLTVMENFVEFMEAEK